MEPPEDGAADETAAGAESPDASAVPDTAPAAAPAAEAAAAEPEAPGPGVAAVAGTTTPEPGTPDPGLVSASDHDGHGDGGDGGDGGHDGYETEDLGGIAGLSLPSRVVLALAVAAVAVGAAFHIGMVFLHVAPPNTLSNEHAAAVNDYIYPEFEQNWKLFAPNPVQENTDVQARAEVRTADGGLQTTGWVDLTAMDIAKIRHDPIPSHTVQNELRRAWGFYTDTHDQQDRAIGLRGDLSQEYVLDIVAHRFGPRLNGGAVQRVQVRVATMPIGAPAWVSQKNDTRTSYRVLPWWAVSAEDFT